jgi:hypothetical protein
MSLGCSQQLPKHGGRMSLGCSNIEVRTIECCTLAPDLLIIYFRLPCSKWVYKNLQFALTRILHFMNISKIFKHCIRLTVSGLGAMIGTTGHVFPSILHYIPSKSDGYRPTFEGFCVCWFLLKPNNLHSKRKICHTHLLDTHLLMFSDVIPVPYSTHHRINKYTRTSTSTSTGTY